MTETEFFDAQFPGTARRLHILRTRDTEFNQMCSDYHEVFCELARAPQTTGEMQPRYLADLAECVSDLRNSIEKRLQATD